jgi:hypothetical protein
VTALVRDPAKLAARPGLTLVTGTPEGVADIEDAFAGAVPEDGVVVQREAQGSAHHRGRSGRQTGLAGQPPGGRPGSLWTPLWAAVGPVGHRSPGRNDPDPEPGEPS